MNTKNDRLILLDEKEKCIENISNFITNLNLSNVHEEFYVFCYMLWKGYFSLNQNFSYNRYGITTKNEDYSIFLGKGTSTHASNLLTSILGKQGVEATTIGVSVRKIKLDSVINIKRNFEMQMKDFNECRRYINERVTFVGNLDDKKRSYIFDSILLSESEVLDNYKLKCVNGTYLVNRKMLKHILNRYCFNDYALASESSADNGFILDSYKKMNRLCLDSKDRFNELYNENKEHYEKIKTLL